MFVGNTDGSPEKVAFYRDRLLALGVDGLLVALSWDITVSDLIPVFCSRHVPIVGVTGARPVPSIDCFLADDVEGAAQACRYLLGLGHRDIAFIGVKDSETTGRRYRGYCQALVDAGCDPPKELFVQTPGYGEDDAYEGVRDLIARNIPFTAIMAFNDVMALGALNALEDQGLAVPERVSVVGFDDTIAAYTRPKLTTVAYPVHELGQTAVERLIARVDGDSSPPALCDDWPPRLVVRQSTRAPLTLTSLLPARKGGAGWQK